MGAGAEVEEQMGEKKEVIGHVANHLWDSHSIHHLELLGCLLRFPSDGVVRR
jgi:hypothetical protein